jgi:hypothetical protein
VVEKVKKKSRVEEKPREIAAGSIYCEYKSNTVQAGKSKKKLLEKRKRLKEGGDIK